jgi:hypothetical protein
VIEVKTTAIECPKCGGFDWEGPTWLGDDGDGDECLSFRCDRCCFYRYEPTLEQRREVESRADRECAESRAALGDKAIN